MQTVDAIKTLVVANRYVQALVVLYSAIDTLAWASLASGDVTRSAFCQWVNTYIKPEKQIGCTAQDLYAARCAILHSSTTDSKMSREGQASELWYVTSAHSMDSLQLYVQRVGARAKVVHFTSLVAAFTDGVMNFGDELRTDQNRARICAERMRHWLRFLTKESDAQGNNYSIV